MPNISLMNRYHKFLLKAGIMTLAGLLGQSALAKCPEITTLAPEIIGNVGTVNISGIPERILFCKQEFKESALSYKPDPSDIVEGGSQKISMGSTIQTFPLDMSINLSGFTPSELNLKNSTLTADFPNVGGSGGSPSLFNFYTNLAVDNCLNAPRGGNQYNLIKEHLRSQAKRFQSGGKRGVRDDDTPNSIARIKDVTISSNQGGAPLIADIIFYHANSTGAPSFNTFSRTYCWVGVGAKMEIKIDNLESINAGDYVVNVVVLTGDLP